MDHEEATTARLRMRDAKTKGDSSVGDTRSVFGQKVAGMFKCVFERMIVLPNHTNTAARWCDSTERALNDVFMCKHDWFNRIHE